MLQCTSVRKIFKDVEYIRKSHFNRFRDLQMIDIFHSLSIAKQLFYAVCSSDYLSLLSIYAAKLKTALLKTHALQAANGSKRAVNAVTALQLIDSRFIIR